MDTRLVRCKELLPRVGLSRTQIWRLEKAGQFPRRRRLGPNSVAWLVAEVDEWVRTRAVVEVGQDAKKKTAKSTPKSAPSR